VLVLALMAACVAVEGERIRVADLAGEVEAFRAAPAGETVAFTPAPGARRILSPGDLRALAARFRIEYAPGPPVCFERRMEPLTRERVLEAVRAVSGDASVEVIDFSRNRVPPGTLVFVPARGELWSGRLRYAEHKTIPVWARVRSTAPVERGDVVEVAARFGEARVAIRAKAEGSGRVGETIVLRREDNNRRLVARVTGKGRAIIDANRSVHRTGGAGGGR
jgi:hypothetical protein